MATSVRSVGGRRGARVGADRRAQGAGQRVGGELGRVQLARAQPAELGGDLVGADAGGVGEAAPRTRLTAALAAAVEAPQPWASKPASAMRSPSTASDSAISSPQA